MPHAKDAPAALRLALLHGRRAKVSLRKLVRLLDKPLRAGKADFWLFDLVPGLDALKYYQVARAKREARKARRLLGGLREALVALEPGALPVDPEDVAVDVGVTVTLADALESFLGDLWAQGRLETSRRQANIALSRVRRVLAALESRRS